MLPFHWWLTPVCRVAVFVRVRCCDSVRHISCASATYKAPRLAEDPIDFLIPLVEILSLTRSYLKNRGSRIVNIPETTNGTIPEVSITSATDPDSVSALIEELSALGRCFLANQSEELRLGLQLKARALWKALETPRETMIRRCWAQVWLFLPRT